MVRLEIVLVLGPVIEYSNGPLTTLLMLLHRNAWAVNETRSLVNQVVAFLFQNLCYIWPLYECIATDLAEKVAM